MTHTSVWFAALDSLAGVTTPFSAPDTSPQLDAEATAPASEEQMLAELAPLLAAQGIELNDGVSPGIEAVAEALAQAVARDKLAVLTPRGAQRERALAVLRRFTETLAAEGEQAARTVLTDVPAEPRGDAPAVAHVIGVAMSTLDEWYADAQLQGALVVVPVLAWAHRPGRAMAGDVLGLARRARAFGALGGLRRRHDGPTILEAAALAIASTAAAWAERDGVALESLLGRVMPAGVPTGNDDRPVSAPDGSSFRRPQGMRAPGRVASPFGSPAEDGLSADALARGFEAWLGQQTAMAAPSVGDELELFGALLERARTHKLDLARAEDVAPFIKVLEEFTEAERPEATHNALATLRDYTHFRLALGADVTQWQAVHAAITNALNGGRLAFATVARSIAEEDDIAPEQRRAAFAQLPMIARVDALLEWIGRSKEVTEAGTLRPNDVELLADMLGGEVQAGESSSLVHAWWTALSHAGVVETSASRARRGPHSGEWAPGETMPLDLAVRVVSIFVAELMALGVVQGGGAAGELRTAEALSGLLRVLGSGNETAPTRDLDDPALQSLAAGGLLARDAEGRWGVPLALRGGVARGIVLAIEILAAGTKSSEPLV